jgi:hypothetical protein
MLLMLHTHKAQNRLPTSDTSQALANTFLRKGDYGNAQYWCKNAVQGRKTTLQILLFYLTIKGGMMCQNQAKLAPRNDNSII